MKNVLITFALSLSLMLSACQSNEEDMLPLSPQFEKMAADEISFPYSYLQAFEEIKEAKISYHPEREGMVLLVNTGSRKVQNMYAVFEQHGTNVMVFLGSSDEQKFFVKNVSPARNITIKIYGGFKNDVRNSNIYPYLPSTTFFNIPVKGWSASDPGIKVTAETFPRGLQHLFAELNTKKGSMLVFLARPANEDFEIPRYGNLGVINLKLYGNLKSRSSIN